MLKFIIDLRFLLLYECCIDIDNLKQSIILLVTYIYLLLNKLYNYLIFVPPQLTIKLIHKCDDSFVHYSLQILRFK